MANPQSTAEIQPLILNDQPDKLVALAEREGKLLAQGNLTTSQIRQVFGQVRQIQAMWRIETQRAQAERLLMLLKPRVAYQAAKAGRDEKEGIDRLRAILNEAIDAIYANSEAGSTERNLRFGRFTELFEALLAYHKVESEQRKDNR